MASPVDGSAYPSIAECCTSWARNEASGTLAVAAGFDVRSGEGLGNVDVHDGLVGPEALKRVAMARNGRCSHQCLGLLRGSMDQVAMTGHIGCRVPITCTMALPVYGLVKIATFVHHP